MIVTFLKENLFAIVGSFLILGLGYFFISWDAVPTRVTDEQHHMKQVQRIYKGDDRTVKAITNIPGYHHITATALKVLQPVFDFPKAKGYHIRGVAIIYAVLVFLMTIVLLRHLGGRDEQVLLIMTLPVLAPYLFLGYTETLSLLTVLVAAYFCLRKWYIPSGLIALVAILIRQDNIIWIGLFMFWSVIAYFIETNKSQPPLHKGEGRGEGSLLEILMNHVRVIPWKKLLAANIIYIAVIIFFLYFMHTNGGVAVGDADAHPATINFDNFYFFLVTFAIIFVPTIISRARAMLRVVLQHKLIVSVITIIFPILYLAGFELNHSYNANHKFLHNKLAHFFSEIPLGIVLGIILSLITILYLYTLAKDNKYQIHLWTIYATSAAFLILHPLMEHRYFIIPMVFITLFTHHKNRLALYTQITFAIVLTAYLYYGAFAAEAFKW